MTKLITTMAFIMTFAAPALAESQIYYPNNLTNYPGDAVPAQVSAQSQEEQIPNTYRVYPGREQYGDAYGYLPHHPGDYRDAVDRGQWEGGGGYRPALRTYSGY